MARWCGIGVLTRAGRLRPVSAFVVEGRSMDFARKRAERYETKRKREFCHPALLLHCRAGAVWAVPPGIALDTVVSTSLRSQTGWTA